ncbi:TonB-dependent receptor [Marinicauda salina]|uniref:TonB-dependent receptor n=1 Tax=Marinicauda salina TaxID=2135793 RepID=UPI001304B55C|nr:TonB-dependent receptor [Marinicauda salina]
MKRHLCITLAAALTATAGAAAQEDGDVIVVTAARIAEARDAGATPVAVLGEAELTRLGSHHIAEALNRAPGVFINRGNGVEHLTAIRSPVLTGGAGAGSFLFLEDGVALRAPGFANVNGLFEAADALAARVEVIRGPGAAVYGSNALHGLVNVITQDPREAGRLAEIEAGSFGRLRARAFAGGETRFGAGFIGASVRHEDGWRDDASLDRGTLQFRADTELGATELSLRGTFLDIDQETATYVGGFKAYEDEALSRANADPEAFRNARSARLSLHLGRRLSEDWRATGVVYGRSNDLAFRLHFLPSEALELSGHDSLGLQSALVRETDRGRLMAGVDLDWTRGYLFEDQTRPTLGPFIQGVHYDYEIDALVVAGFVQGRLDVGDSLAIEGGARLETTAYDYDNLTADGAVGRYLRPADRSDDYTTVAPHLGFTYDASENIQLFGRAARGVRAPQTAELYRLQPGQVIEGIDPETLDSLEAGVRVGLPRDGRIEVTGFVMEKENVFFRDADGFNVTDGATDHVGVEVDLHAPITDTLAVRGSLTWADHEYAFDRPVGRSSESISDGAQVDTAPEWLWNARLIWTPVETATAELEWVHVGEYFLDAANSASYEGHDVINVRGRYALRDGLEVFAAIRNAGDVRYAERADFAFGGYRYFPGEPRSVSIGVRLTG